MKKITLLIVLLSSFTFAQKIQVLDYSKLDKSDMKTDLLIKNTSPFSPIGKNYSKNGMYTFIQAYKELSNNDDLKRLQKTNEIQRFTKTVSYAETVKIGLIHSEYESLNKQALEEQKIRLENNSVIRNTSEYIFTKNTSTIIAPLCINKKGLHTKFELASDFYFNNTTNNLSEVKADFDDGSGLQTISFNSPIQVNYQSEGDKNLIFKLTFSDGSTINRLSKINIQYSNKDIISLNNQRIVNEVTSTIIPNLGAYSGATNSAGMAEYEIFLGADNVLDKPIFLIDGFDPADSRNTMAIYNMLNYDVGGGVIENLGTKIREEENFDIVIINHPQYFILSNGSLQSMANSTDVNNNGVIDTADYPGSTLIDGGSDFIERNAMSTIEVINLINSQKVGAEENVIIGPSMGGLISRYALNYMESVSIDHETRLWISFDSPHLGANVPIGFQHLFNYLGYGLDTPLGDYSIEAIRPVVEGMLKSGAARQMLRDQFEAHLASGSTLDFDPTKLLPEAHPFNPIFYDNMNGLTSSGYPEDTRNVSIINGSGIGAPYKNKNGSDVTPGQQVLDVFIEEVATLTDAYLDAWLTPTSGTTAKISEVWIDIVFICFCDIETEENAQAPAYSDGIDAAPGGLFDIGALAADFGGDPTIDAFFAGLTTDYFNFIPAVSAIALINGGSSDWYQNINLGAGDTPWDASTTTNPNTPFVNWYIPDENEGHVTLTPSNVAFAWEEIIDTNTLSINNTLIENFIKLEQNPITNNLTLISSKDYQNAEISIIDMTGKLVYNNKTNLNGKTSIPLNLASGLYILNVDTNTDYILKTKVILK
ncbi:T9SS type A sorting domain-containing protein [Formosa maritima]|uniref:T9SS type A sorting domain-containing protein n=1 Tax=Formosa maritima TaxID=2592046 RepID=A0A5D0G247_9FLAO|nr:T9SS type A sorting domain-containing protein [Formosa maritima]TYA53183.1 T9SS type A sorting domain-containing protein [Formosa maritima]